MSKTDVLSVEQFRKIREKSVINSKGHISIDEVSYKSITSDIKKDNKKTVHSAKMETKRNTNNKNKFHAQKTVYNNITFDSKKEANFCERLDNLIKSGDVLSYERQIKYDITINNIKCCYYKLDFLINYANGNIEYVDIKGLKRGCSYQMFRLKKKLVEASYGIVIKEI